MEDVNELRLIVNLVEQIFIIWLRTYTTESAFGAQKGFSAIYPYEKTHLEYSGVNQASPLRNNPKTTTKDADGLTEKEQNLRKGLRNKERREAHSAEESATAKAAHAAYSKFVNKPVQKFKKKAISAGMTEDAINKIVKDFQLLARLAKKNKTNLPNAEDHLRITR